MSLDIGSIKAFSDSLTAPGPLFGLDGTMGVFEIEKFAAGTQAIAKKLADLSEWVVTTIVGSGDSLAAVEKADIAGKMNHVSTGGGASLELLEGVSSRSSCSGWCSASFTLE